MVNGGSLYDIDIQQKILEVLEKRATKNGVSYVIVPIKCSENCWNFQS